MTISILRHFTRRPRGFNALMYAASYTEIMPADLKEDEIDETNSLIMYLFQKDPSCLLSNGELVTSSECSFRIQTSDGMHEMIETSSAKRSARDMALSNGEFKIVEFIDQLVACNVPKYVPLKVFLEDNCVICYDAEPEVILCPCGHKNCCQECWNEHKRTNSKCPICGLKVYREMVDE